MYVIHMHKYNNITNWKCSEVKLPQIFLCTHLHLIMSVIVDAT